MLAFQHFSTPPLAACQHGGFAALSARRLPSVGGSLASQQRLTNADKRRRQPERAEMLSD
jgi:hypothetical protein